MWAVNDNVNVNVNDNDNDILSKTSFDAEHPKNNQNNAHQDHLHKREVVPPNQCEKPPARSSPNPKNEHRKQVFGKLQELFPQITSSLIGKVATSLTNAQLTPEQIPKLKAHCDHLAETQWSRDGTPASYKITALPNHIQSYLNSIKKEAKLKKKRVDFTKLWES